MGAAAGAAAGAALDAESLASGAGSAAGRPPGAGKAARAIKLPEEGTGPAAVSFAVVRGAPDTAVMVGTGGPGDTGPTGMAAAAARTGVTLALPETCGQPPALTATLATGTAAALGHAALALAEATVGVTAHTNTVIC